MRARRAWLLCAAAVTVAAACNAVKLSSPYVAPERMSALSEPGAVLFTWSAAPGATGYLLWVSPNPDPQTASTGMLLSGTQRSYRATGTGTLYATIVTRHDEPSGYRLSDASPVISADALPTTRFATPGDKLPSTGAGTEFGWDVAAPGDLDGDGVGDALVGAPTDAGSGLARLISGATQSTLLTVDGPGAGAEYGQTLAGPGDAQGNGRGDVFVGGPKSGRVTVAYDGVGGLEQSFNGTGQFDLSALVADVDHDGHADLLIGRPDDTGTSGKVELVPGSSTGFPSAPTTTISSSTHPLGHSLGVGDFNGDGKTDLLVGAWGGGPQNEGELCFVGDFLATSPATVCTLGVNSNGFLGDSIAVLGDVDGDGRDDALVVDYPDDGARHVQLWTGAATPAGVRLASWQWTLGVDGLTVAKNPMHHLVAATGDLDGDGRPDALVADPGDNQVMLFLGEGTSLAASPAEVIVDPSPLGGPGGDDEFGVSIAYGNLDDDLQPDLLVGSPGSAAEAYVFHGLPSRGPEVDAGPPVTTRVGDSFFLEPAAYDPVGKPGAPTCSVAWGDGQSEEFDCVSAPGAHGYDAAGTYHPTVTMTTADGRVGVSFTTVYVR